MVAFKLPRDGIVVEPNLHRIIELLTYLTDFRMARVTVDDFPLDVQQELCALCGVPMRGVDPPSVAKGLADLTEMFGPSFNQVVLQADSAWGSLNVKGLRAHLAIIGMPIPTKTTQRPALLALIQQARSLAVLQGHLIPEVLRPFLSFNLPTKELFTQASHLLQTALVVAVIDENSDVPPPEQYVDVIAAYAGGYHGP